MTAFDIMDALNDVDEKLLDAALEEKTARSSRRYVKIAVAAVIAAALLIGAAIAASSDGFLSELFGESYDIIGDYVMMEPISVENEYARLTVESALSDGFTAYLIFSVERLDGGTIENMGLDIETTPVYETQNTHYGGHFTEPFVTGKETPQKQWYKLYRSGDTGLVGMEIRLFGLRNWDTGERINFGELKQEITFKESPLKIGGPGGDPMGSEVYTKIILSPLGLRIRARVNLNLLTPDGSGEMAQPEYISEAACSAVLIYKDGSCREITEPLYRRFAAVRYDILANFAEPLDIEQVDAIEIDGVRYELEYGELDDYIMQWESGNGYLAMQREYVYEDHQPLYPLISAQNDDLRVEMESVWTDGSEVEMFLLVESLAEKRDWTGIVPYSYNGYMEITALDKKGEKLAVSAEFVNVGKLEDGRGLYGYIIHIGGEGEKLIINADGAEINIPLNMRKLKRMPQGEPYTEPPREIDKDNKTDMYKEHYDHLFGNRDLPRVDISADNGEYGITVEYMWQTVSGGKGQLKAMVRCERLDGEAYDRSTPRKELEIGVVFNGEYRAATSVSGGFGLNWFEDEVRYSAANIDYEFRSGARDTVRLIWTPPAGERIVLDIPIE